MQAVIAIPTRQTLQQFGGVEQALMQEVAGVPLLVRVIATAMRGGVDSLLVIWPDDVDSSIWERCAASRPLRGLKLYKLFRPPMFDPRSAATWAAIATSLEGRFLWLPWNWITHKRVFAELSPRPYRPLNWESPASIEKCARPSASRSRSVKPSSNVRPRRGNGLGMSSGRISPVGILCSSPITCTRGGRCAIHSSRGMSGIWKNG